MQLIRNIYFSFPVQLLLLHLRRHLFLALSFLLPILIVTKNFGSHYGLAYLYLDPEYLSHVSFWSFFIVGIAFGSFVLIWNITSYILNSNRFPFLATFQKPFLRYCLNNALIPLLFVLIYFIALINFQIFSEFKPWYDILTYIVGFCSGGIVILLIAFSESLNTSFDTGEGKKSTPQHSVSNTKFSLRKWQFNKGFILRKKIRVDFLLIYPWKVRLVRDVSHYDEESLLVVFKQHHKNALILELIALEIVILLGFMMDYKLFRIPASASMLLLFSILIAPSGAFAYYLRTWGTTVFILLVLFFNLLISFNIFNHRNSAFGLNYSGEKPEYNLETIAAASNPSVYEHDKKLGLQMLENWKKKVSPPNDSTYKPTMVLINASGGGLRATVWSFYLMQIADSVTANKFFEHTVLIAGASGGTFGEAYYRELALRKKNGENLKINSGEFLTNSSKDMLNAVSFAMVVNDLLIPWQRFRVGDYLYRKDRGYLWEKEMNENTGGVLNKPISAYAGPELRAEIPMLVFTPTIIDDARRLNISALPVAYLNRPEKSLEPNSALKVDGIDLMNFFKDRNPGQLQFTTAIRMNATFPYVMPNVFMPTTPQIQVMDAGLRDNYGMETSIRFLNTFRDWIDANVGRIVIMQIRDMKKNPEPKVEPHQSVLKKIADPLNSIYANWSDYQDFHFDNSINTANSWLNNKLSILYFEYAPSKLNESASMSWHLTTKEKQDVINAINSNRNQKELKKLMSIFNQ